MLMDNPTKFSESFLLGVIVSFGGLITVVFASIRKSRCTTLECCGVKCVREPLSEDAIHKEIQLEHMEAGNVL